MTEKAPRPIEDFSSSPAWDEETPEITQPPDENVDTSEDQDVGDGETEAPEDDGSVPAEAEESKPGSSGSEPV